MLEQEQFRYFCTKQVERLFTQHKPIWQPCPRFANSLLLRVSASSHNFGSNRLCCFVYSHSTIQYVLYKMIIYDIVTILLQHNSPRSQHIYLSEPQECIPLSLQQQDLCILCHRIQLATFSSPLPNDILRRPCHNLSHQTSPPGLPGRPPHYEYQVLHDSAKQCRQASSRAALGAACDV